MKENTENIDYEDLITRYLAQEATTEEQNELEAWMSSKAENQSTFDSFKKTWDEVGKVEDLAGLDIDNEWAVLQHRLDISEEEGIVPIQGRRRSIPRLVMISLAAILLVFLISTVTLNFFYGTFNERKFVSRTDVELEELPDGSLFTLNKRSSLVYSKDFNTKERKVTLKGRAFFEITRNTGKPFIIQAGNATIEVLGTSFYVNASDKTRQVEVIVNKGTVALYETDNPDNKIILEAGEKGSLYMLENDLIKSTEFDPNYLSWKTNRLVFKQVKLIEIVALLNELYKSKVIITSKEIEQCNVTVTFEDQSLEEIINVLESTLDLKVKKKRKKILLSGEGC